MKTKFVYSIITILFCLNLYADTDSLKMVKVDSLIEVGKKKVEDDINESLDCFSRAINILDDLDIGELSNADKIKLTRCYHNRAFYCEMNNVYLKRSILDLKKRIGLIGDTISLSLGGSYNTLAIIYRKRGDYDMAEDSYLNAIRIFEELDRKNILFTIKVNLAMLYYRKNEICASLNILNNNISLIDEASNKFRYLNMFGNIYFDLKEFDIAYDYYKQGLAYASDSREKANLKNNLGLTLGELNKYQEAIIELNESFNLLKKENKTEYNIEYGNYYTNKGDVFFNRGSVFCSKDQLDSALIYHNLAVIHCLEDSTWETKDVFENPSDKQLKLCEVKPLLLNYLETKASTAYFMYDTFDEEKYLELALDTYDTCDRLLKFMLKEYIIDESKLNWVKNSRKIYADAIDVCIKISENETDERMKNNYLEKALFYLNSSKAVLLNEQLNKFKLAQSSNISPEKFEEEKALFLDLRNADTVSVKLNRKIDLLREEMKREDPQFFSLLYEIPDFELKEIQEKLDKETSIIEYFYTDESIIAFQITHDAVKAEPVTLIENFDSLIRQFKRVLISPSVENGLGSEYDRVLTEDGLKIYNLLLKRFEGNLTKNLVIIPDGPLFDLPFGVLPTSKFKIKRQNYGDVPYLIKNPNLSYANSIRTLLNQMEYNVQVDNNYIGIAPVDFSSDPNLDNLAQTEVEVKNGQRIFGGDVLLRYEAKLDEFQKYIKMRNYNIIHFATHASSFDPKTNLPTIYFSDTTYNINQIYASDINANLGVLSVCEAGNGEQVAGEGVMSLVRAFAYIGIPSILTSLSKVGEKSSAFLMDEFYKNINAGQRKDIALKNAKLEIIEGKFNAGDSSAMPCNWGSFVVVGDTKALFHKKSFLLGYVGVLCLILLLGIGFRNKWFGF